MSSLKRKVHVSSAGDGPNICELAAAKTPYSTIAEKFGIGRSTTVDIRKQEQALRDFQRKAVEMNLPEARSMKTGDFEDLDEALYLWFRSANRTWTSAGTCSWSKQKSFMRKCTQGTSVC